MSIISLDGTKIEVLPPDLDGDGMTGGIEKIHTPVDAGVSNINHPTELGESLKELNKDSIEPNTRMSGIDLRSRLYPVEVSSILALDALVSFGILPRKCLAFTRQKKRLAVSLNGQGREDIVNIVGGKKEQDAKMGMGGMDRIKNFFGVQQNKEQQ